MRHRRGGWAQLVTRLSTRKCRSWSCRSGDPMHDAHLTWIGYRIYVRDFQ